MKVLILGSRGYSGQELCKIAARHPEISAVALGVTDARAEAPYYLLNGKVACSTVVTSDPSSLDLTFDAAFLATPASISMAWAPALLARGVRTIDLSGAFRLPQAVFEGAYAETHHAPKLLDVAQYGLVPFAGPKAASLIANPGCYATSVLMALIPLVKTGLIDPSSIWVDAKSGTTGAGKRAHESLLFSEVAGECTPYKVGCHQHEPEIARVLGHEVPVTTHLLPIQRGILSSIYAKVTPGVTEQEISQVYEEHFASYPLVRFLPFSKAEALGLHKIGSVVHTPYVHLSYKVVSDRLMLFSVLDNLLKGAASQAFENFNRIYDLPVSTGLVNERHS